MMAKMNNVDPELARRHHCPLGIDDTRLTRDSCPYRRLIFVKVEKESGVQLSDRGVFDFKTKRTPVGFADMDVMTGEIVKTQEVGKTTGWRDVPTPAI